jgi:hypothetical protein
VKNIKQLYYIVDFLLEYISNKERVFKEKINEMNKPNGDDIYEEKMRNVIQIIEKNNLMSLFKDVLSNNSTTNDKYSLTSNQSVNFNTTSGPYLKNKPQMNSTLRSNNSNK